MSKIKKSSQFLKQQSQKSMLMYQKQKKFQQYMTQNQLEMRDVKIKLQQLKDEDIKSMLNTKKQISSLNQEIQALKRERARYQDMINKQKKENDRIIGNFNKYQLWMDQKVESMNTQYLKLKKDTLQMTAYVKNDYETTALKFKQLQQTIQEKMLANDQKYRILQLYLTQRQQMKKKMVQIQQMFPKYALLSQIQYLRNCQTKQLEMNKTEINNILDTYLPPKVKQMLPQIQQKVNQFDKMSTQINDIKTNVFQSQQQILNFKQSTQSLQSNFRKQFRQINQTLTTNIQVLRTDVKVALAIDQKQTQQRKKFQQKFSTQIHSFVQKQNLNIYKKMQQQTFLKLDQIQKQDNNKMQEQQKQIEMKCNQMRQISNNIQNLLANYNNRIIKIRSDSQLFKNQVMKEMKVITNMRNQNNQRFQDMGKILASLIEVITMNLTIQMNLDKNCLRSDNFAFATYNDGLIYQVVPYNAKEGETNNLNQITYRRTDLEIPHLRRSILAGMVTLIDQIYQSYPYLQWSRHKPSTFFKQQILHHYQVQYQKYGSLLQNTVRSSSFQKTNNNNFMTKNNNQTGSLLFKRSKISQKAYSPPRNKQNSTIYVGEQNENNSHYKTNVNETIYNNFQELGQTIDENIQIRVTNGESSILMNDYDKQNIKRGMRTIHQVYNRDGNNNRFMLSGLGNRSSLSKDHGMTIDHIPPQSAGGSRKRYLAKSKKQSRHSRYHNNDLQTFMTSRSSKRTTSIGNYKF